ncbi:ABC transporter ATP-binding protein [Legionella gresilensis]|uniref:ABC transporter ATP-binding protein n=1 Tax=Legionella gresilensis TaxID=91823 RepID=UPI0010419EAA|nr:ABC transporter ATP-binding protein [Legionella gresilensis]
MINSDAIIKLVNVNYSIPVDDGTLTILDSINLSIPAGATIAITGVSGSGKTTLLNIMAGLEKPTSGRVYYGLQEISSLNEDSRAKLRAEQIGFIFQFFHLLPNLNALENVMLPLEINRKKNPTSIALDWLTQMGLSKRAKHYPNQLSGGEQQRVAIARAFALTPAVLFADEPTGNLDKKTGQAIINLLFSLNQQYQSTLVIVTHDDTLAAHCQMHWPLIDGQLQC